MQVVSAEKWVSSIQRFWKTTKRHRFNAKRVTKMKLVQEDEKNSLNGVSKEDVGDKEIEEIAANGDDLLCPDSRSNPDSLSSEDALMKDNGAKEGSQNGGGRLDDMRSWSSSSSILPSPAELEDDFSEDLRLQISDEEEEEPKSLLTETALEKDSPHLPSICEPSFSDVKNPFRELLDDEGCATLQKTIKDTPQPNETVEEASSSIQAANNLDNNDSVNEIHNENNIISDNKESGEKSNLDALIADIVPDNKLLNELSTKSDNDSVTELRQEIEDVLKKGDDLETESTGKISTIDDDSEQSADKMEVDSNNDHKVEETVDKIQGTQIEDINDKIENMNDEIEDTDNKIKKTDAKNEDSENKIEDIHKVEETDKKSEEIDNKIEETDNKINTDNKIEETDNKINTDNKIEETNNKVEETGNTIEETGNKCEEIQNNIEETGDKIEEIYNKIEDTNNKIEDTNNTIEDTNNTLEDTNNKIEDTDNKIEDTDIKREESADLIDDSDITTEDSDIKIEETGDKIEDTDNKIQNSDNKIEETLTEKEDIPEKRIENDALNMEIDENPSANNDDNAEESDITSNSEALDLLEKEDHITNSVPDNNQISKDNDDVMDVVMEDNSETSNAVEEISEKSSVEPVVETTRPPGVTTNMEEPMEITEIDNVEDTEKEIDSSTAEEADIVSTENNDVQSNKIEKELTKNAIVENTSTETKEILKEEIKAEETKKELNEGTTEIPKCLKRSLEEEDDNIDAKKPKINGLAVDPPKKREYVALNFFRNLMAKKDVKSMTRLEMEELCLQKMCEVVNQTSKIGELQRTLKQQEQITEGLRTKYAGLKKQISDLTIVHTKIMQEMKSKLPDGIKDGSTIRDIMPVKITRSVGLQVNLQTGMRAMRVQASAEKTLPAPTVPVQKRKIQRTSLPNRLPSTQQPTVPTPTPAKPIGATIPKSPNGIPFQNSTPKTGIKTILPKESSGNTTPGNSPSLLSNYLLSSPANSKASTPPTATRKTPVPTTTNTSSATTATIDLTDEDDKTAGTPAPTSTAPSIRVVNPQLMGQVTTATTKSVPITYLVAPNQPQQVILTSNNSAAKPGQVRPAFMLRSVPGQVQQGIRLNIMRPQTPGSNQGLVLPSANATVRTSQPLRIQQVPTTTTTNAVARTQMSSGRVTRHPAPLPGPPAVQPSQPTWKAMPPKPSLKISRVGDGIVLSWKMLNKNMSLYEDIASYQLYAYQETSSAPATEMWRKVGDVKALALPMACTLTQFTDGNKYHFAVRAVDVKSRVGPFSQPEQIALP